MDLIAVIGATGFLEKRWQDGRRQGLRAALELIDLLAPLDGGSTLAFSLHSEVFIATLDRFRSNAMAAGLVGGALAGEVVGALALTEDGGGSDPSAVTTTCVELPDGRWRLDGHKRFTSNLESATHCIVLADGRSGLRQGPTLYLVPLHTEGVRLVGTYPKLGTNSVGAWRLEFESAVLQADARLGPIGAGLPAVFRCLRAERLAVSRAVISGAAHSLGLSVAYLRSRSTSGTRLYDRSALSHKVAECDVQIRAAEAMLESVTVRDLDGTAEDVDYAALKLFCARTATEVADAAMQMMGGRGYTSRYPHERIWRDARLARIGAGTDEMMLEIIARRLDRPTPASSLLEQMRSTDLPDHEVRPRDQ